MMIFKDEDTRKNRTCKFIGDPVSLENYDNLKVEEINEELNMHKKFILEDVVPLLNSDLIMLHHSPNILQAFIKFGANCICNTQAVRFEGSPKDSIKIALQLDDQNYQKLIKELRFSQKSSP